ncbi:MAG: hypothetical protein JXR48_02715 [Candidatus Delongbacteria bacterium]|nr:hypothetical protein [Candidatus Delongbacteria bacterium]
MYTIFMITILVTNLLVIDIYSPKAPPAIPLINSSILQNVIFYDNLNTAIVPKLLKKEIGLYIIPTNVAAKLYNKGLDIIVLGTLSEGFIYFCSTDGSDYNNLDEKEIYVGGKGSSPDVINNMLIKNVKNIRYSGSSEIAKLMIAGKISNCILPQPLASMVYFSADAKLQDLRKRYKEKFLTENIPQVCMVIDRNYYSENRNEIDRIILDYKREIDQIYSGQINAEIILDKLKWNMTEDQLKIAIKTMNLSFSLDIESITIYLKNLLSTTPETIGGKLPDEKIFIP